MSKYHLTENGPGECNAKKRTCPLGGEHFFSEKEAEAAFAKKFANEKPLAKSKHSGTSITTRVVPMAGGHYFGCHVEASSLGNQLDSFRKNVGPEKAAEMEAKKAQRDRGYIFHLTVVTPPEMKGLKGPKTDFPETVNIDYVGVGSLSDGKSEAWFVVCESEEIAAWREENGLPPKDLHITLGFDPKDVHVGSKGRDTIVTDASGTNEDLKDRVREFIAERSAVHAEIANWDASEADREMDKWVENAWGDFFSDDEMDEALELYSELNEE